MERLYSNIIGTPIVEDDGFRPIASVKDIVIDPERGKIIALVVDTNRNRIIIPMDILSWGEAIAVHDNGVIIDGDEILRVDEVQKKNIDILENKVVTEAGEELGRVKDLTVDGKTLEVRKLFVSKEILGLIRFESRIIDARDIIEITKEKVVVKENMRVIKEEAEVAREGRAMA